VTDPDAPEFPAFGIDTSNLSKSLPKLNEPKLLGCLDASDVFALILRMPLTAADPRPGVSAVNLTDTANVT